MVLVCHIGDEESVPDVRVHPTHIQKEWSIPRDGDGVTAVVNTHITDLSQYT